MKKTRYHLEKQDENQDLLWIDIEADHIVGAGPGERWGAVYGGRTWYDYYSGVEPKVLQVGDSIRWTESPDNPAFLAIRYPIARIEDLLFFGVERVTTIRSASYGMRIHWWAAREIARVQKETYYLRIIAVPVVSVEGLVAVYIEQVSNRKIGPAKVRVGGVCGTFDPDVLVDDQVVFNPLGKRIPLYDDLDEPIENYLTRWAQSYDWGPEDKTEEP